MDMARQILSVVFVFALLGLALWLLRRNGLALPAAWRRRVGGRERKLRSVERLILTPQHSLHLIRMNGAEIIVATHPQGCSVLLDAAGASRGTGA